MAASPGFTRILIRTMDDRSKDQGNKRSKKMKLNRILGLVVIGLLAVGGLGFISTRSVSRAQAARSQQTQVTSVAPDTETPGGKEVASCPDTDNIQQQVGQQVGQQVEDSLPDNAAAPAKEDAGTNLQTPGNSSSPTSRGMNSATGVAVAASPASITFVNAKTAPLASTSSSSKSGIAAQSGLQVEDGLPDGTETPGSEEVASGPDTDNIQQQVGDQSGQQVEDGQPDNPASSGQ
jgi:hypothetical protein